MSTSPQATPFAPSTPPHLSRGRLWAGWILSLLPALMLITGGINAFRAAPVVIEGTRHLGYPVTALAIMGTLELVCSVLYLIPATSVYGALLLTAFFGGATASHVRIGESAFIVPVIFGVIVWLGLALRDPRVAHLLSRRS